MKRHVAVAVACAALALFAASCSSGDDGDDGASTATGSSLPENPRSVIIAENAMLTADDFPAWWEVADADPAVAEALLNSHTACQALASAQLSTESKQDGRAGPTTFQEIDGIRRLDLSLRIYPEVAEAEEFMSELEASDTTDCLDAVLGSLGPPNANPGPATWGDPPPFGDESLTITVPVAPGESLEEDAVLRYIWVRVDRAVFQLIYTGPTADDPENYVNTVATRLTEELAGGGEGD